LLKKIFVTHTLLLLYKYKLKCVTHFNQRFKVYKIMIVFYDFFYLFQLGFLEIVQTKLLSYVTPCAQLICHWLILIHHEYALMLDDIPFSRDVTFTSYRCVSTGFRCTCHTCIPNSRLPFPRWDRIQGHDYCWHTSTELCKLYNLRFLYVSSS
jgi:hypothetical protein